MSAGVLSPSSISNAAIGAEDPYLISTLIPLDSSNCSTIGPIKDSFRPE